MLTPTLSLDKDNGNERAKLPVIGSSGAPSYTLPQSGNYTITQGVDFAVSGRELFIQNDGNANITVVVNTIEGGSLGFLIEPGEQFDERLPLFSSVIVTSSGNWRWRVRGNAS
jgi:hypothetical protein